VYSNDTCINNNIIQLLYFKCTHEKPDNFVRFTWFSSEAIVNLKEKHTTYWTKAALKYRGCISSTVELQTQARIP